MTLEGEWYSLVTTLDLSIRFELSFMSLQRVMSDIYVTHRGDRVTTSRHAIRYIDMRSENSFMFEAALSGFSRFPVKQLQLSFAALSP